MVEYSGGNRQPQPNLTPGEEFLKYLLYAEGAASIVAAGGGWSSIGIEPGDALLAGLGIGAVTLGLAKVRLMMDEQKPSIKSALIGGVTGIAAGVGSYLLFSRGINYFGIPGSQATGAFMGGINAFLVGDVAHRVVRINQKRK